MNPQIVALFMTLAGLILLVKSQFTPKDPSLRAEYFRKWQKNALKNPNAKVSVHKYMAERIDDDGLDLLGNHATVPRRGLRSYSNGNPFAVSVYWR